MPPVITTPPRPLKRQAADSGCRFTAPIAAEHRVGRDYQHGVRQHRDNRKKDRDYREKECGQKEVARPLQACPCVFARAPHPRAAMLAQ